MEEGTRLKVLYGSANGFHAVDLDSASVYDIYLPKHSQGPIQPHTIVTLPNSNGMQLLLCYDNEGVYVNTYGKVSKNIVLQVPTNHPCSTQSHLALMAKTLVFFDSFHFTLRIPFAT